MMRQHLVRALLCGALCALVLPTALSAQRADDDEKAVRVFVFAGQSNMEGADSKATDIQRFPPFRGLEKPQPETLFHYCLGRDNKTRSDDWVALQPVNNMVGPELAFARRVTKETGARLAILKVAAGGTHLGGDWNPDEPQGFEMYRLAIAEIRKGLDGLERRGLRYRLEGFMWHQGENDMFNAEYQKNYGANLKRLLECFRRDLKAPALRFYIGELCTKTIWGMDLRPRMYAISLGQRAVTDEDPLAEYVPTSHVGVEIGGGVGLHYHYGTLGQLQHGESYAEAYLRHLGLSTKPERPLKKWPYEKDSEVELFILAGHRNMEGERAFTQELAQVKNGKRLLKDDGGIAFRYDVGGGFRVSNDWEPLGPAGAYDTFGPELSFGAALKKQLKSNIAIAKFTHSGSQVIDWAPAGSEAKSRNLYEPFLGFVRESVQSLEDRGHEVRLAGIVYHLGENDMSWMPARNKTATRLKSLVASSRKDLGMPGLRWFVSQQEPTDHERVNDFDAVAAVREIAAEDPLLEHIEVFGLPGREQALVLRTAGIVELGKRLARAVAAKDR